MVFSMDELLGHFGGFDKVFEKFYRVVNVITNAAFIFLIPQKLDSLKLGDYRPISLVSS